MLAKRKRDESVEANTSCLKDRRVHEFNILAFVENNARNARRNVNNKRVALEDLYDSAILPMDDQRKGDIFLRYQELQSSLIMLDLADKAVALHSPVVAVPASETDVETIRGAAARIKALVAPIVIAEKKARKARRLLRDATRNLNSAVIRLEDVNTGADALLNYLRDPAIFEFQSNKIYDLKIEKINKKVSNAREKLDNALKELNIVQIETPEVKITEKFLIKANIAIDSATNFIDSLQEIRMRKAQKTLNDQMISVLENVSRQTQALEKEIVATAPSSFTLLRDRENHTDEAPHVSAVPLNSGLAMQPKKEAKKESKRESKKEAKTEVRKPAGPLRNALFTARSKARRPANFAFDTMTKEARERLKRNLEAASKNNAPALGSIRPK